MQKFTIILNITFWLKASRNIQNQMVMLFVSITVIFTVVPLDILCCMNKSKEQFLPF